MVVGQDELEELIADMTDEQEGPVQNYIPCRLLIEKQNHILSGQQPRRGLSLDHVLVVDEQTVDNLELWAL